MPFIKMAVEDFAAELATGSPMPGGGAAAAAVGAFAASLGAMVCHLTIGSEKYPQARDVLPAALEVFDRSRQKLLLLADADAEAFGKVMAAFRLPAETEREKAARRAAIAAATAEATRTPVETAEAAVAVAEALVQAVRFGNVNAAGDCGVGIECARTAVRCALRNVAINLPGVEDAELAAGFAAKKEELEKRSALCYDTALGILKEKLQ